MKKNANKGFSLVELIIVIAIMAVLIGVLAPQFIKQVEKSRESTDLQNIEEYKTAIETFAAENEGLTANIKITHANATDTTASITGMTATELEAYGLGTSLTLKSKKWTAWEWEYNKDTLKWNTATGNATYFNIDGTNHTS